MLCSRSLLFANGDPTRLDLGIIPFDTIGTCSLTAVVLIPRQLLELRGAANQPRRSGI